jgi:hypothetical protein
VEKSAASLRLHRSSGWLSGSVGNIAVARRTRVGSAAAKLLQPGQYQLRRALDGQAARGIIAILRGGERAIIVEGGRNAGVLRGIIVEGGKAAGEDRAIIIEGGRAAAGARGIIIEGSRVASGSRSIIIEGGRGSASERGIIIEGGIDWLAALEAGTLEIVG